MMMGFVSERVPETDQARLDREYSAFSLRDGSGDYFKWAIDREKNVFLIPIQRSGRPDSPYEKEMLMGWKDVPIGIQLSFEIEGRNNPPNEINEVVTWSLEELYIPKEVESFRPQILSDLKRALDVYGFSGRREFIRDVRFEF